VLQDVQGSTRAVMSGTSVIARHDFLPFGEEISAGTGMRTSGQGFGVIDKIRQRYAMTEHDDTSGLDHTWWRKYDNRSGRWTSPDSYNGSATTADPQSFNRFSYVQNDPVNFVDPSGLKEELVFNASARNGYWFSLASATCCFSFYFSQIRNPDASGFGTCLRLLLLPSLSCTCRFANAKLYHYPGTGSGSISLQVSDKL